MGGWLALLLTLRRQARVKGLVLLAPAPDFTDDLLKLFTAEDKALLRQNGVIYRPNAYGSPHPFTQALFDDGEKYLLLNGDIRLECPVRIIHGLKDADVPARKSEQILKCLKSPDVKVTWVEDGDHRLSRPQDLALIGRTVAELG
jgi:pimeloyl-ACP methyl ester carboxylesterase